MNPSSYMVAKYLIVFGLFIAGTTASAQTSDMQSKASQPEALSVISSVTVDTKIRQELKSHVSSLRFKQDGVRIIRIAKDTHSLGTLKSNPATQLKNVPEKTRQALEAGAEFHQSEYAISCNPLGLPDSIDETYGIPAKGQKAILSKTDSGIAFKAYKKASSDQLKTLERIAQLSCVEAEIK